MAIATAKYLNLAVKSFDDADKFIGIEPAGEVAYQASTMLKAIGNAVVDFAMENDDDIRKMYGIMSSELGSKRTYNMQNIAFANDSFNDYIGKVCSIPDAIKNGDVPEDLNLDAAFFDRDRKFNLALFSTDENECVPIPAEDAFAEIGHMQTLIKMTENFSKQLQEMAAKTPAKTDAMDGVYAKQYDMSLMAVRLMATSMVRYSAILLRHIVNATSELFDHVTSDSGRTEVPTISWKGDAEKSPESQENRWAIFV